MRAKKADPLGGGFEGVKAALAMAREAAGPLAEFKAGCAQPEHCTYCGSWSDRAVAKVCPVCHWCGDLAVQVWHWCKVQTAGEARKELGLTADRLR